MKICPKCEIEKNDFDFSPSNFSRIGGQCRTCTKIYKKQHSLTNAEKIKLDQKQYYTKNKEKKSNYNTRYYISNKKEIDSRKSQRTLLRKKSDPTFRLRINCSSLVRTALQRNGFSKKGLSILKYLPYSIEELKLHLEHQFEPWMTWDNYGVYKVSIWDDNNQSTWTWQLDHIIPQSKLPYTSMEDDNFKKCWSLDNLRPLSEKQNIIEGDR